MLARMRRVQNLLPKACLAVTLLPIPAHVISLLAYNFLYWRAPAHLLLEDGIVSSVVLRIAPGIALLTNIMLATYRAAATRDWLWLIASIVIWPMSFWYTLVETRGTSANSHTHGSA